MKKLVSAITTMVITGILFTVPLTAGAVAKNAAPAKKTVVVKAVVAKTFTLAQLKKYDGQNGNPAYVAIDGVVYDVTSAWGGGMHNGVTAGNDVSKDIGRSPHGKSVLKKLPVVGKLKK